MFWSILFLQIFCIIGISDTKHQILFNINENKNLKDNNDFNDFSNNNNNNNNNNDNDINNKMVRPLYPM